MKKIDCPDSMFLIGTEAEELIDLVFDITFAITQSSVGCSPVTLKIYVFI